MESTKKTRRVRKDKKSYLNDWEDDFNDIESNFKKSNEFDKKTLTAKPQRKETKKQSLVSVTASVGPVIEIIKTDSNIIDKGFYLDDKPESPKETFGLPLKEGEVEQKDEFALSQSDIQTVQIKYENKLKMLEEENQRLKNSNAPLSKNEEKLLSAIRSEILNQSSQAPVIGRTKFLTKLGMNSKYLDDSIKGLVDKKIIERAPVKYSAKIMTNSWKILK